jgi:hypothetical protein
MSNYSIQFVVRWTTITASRLANQPQPLERNTSKINGLYRNCDAVDRSRVGDNHLYVTEVRADGDRTSSFARAISAECDQPLSVQIGNSNLA